VTPEDKSTYRSLCFRMNFQKAGQSEWRKTSEIPNTVAHRRELLCTFTRRMRVLNGKLVFMVSGQCRADALQDPTPGETRCSCFYRILCKPGCSVAEMLRTESLQSPLGNGRL
jgi:hypothetical protein